MNLGRRLVVWKFLNQTSISVPLWSRWVLCRQLIQNVNLFYSSCFLLSTYFCQWEFPYALSPWNETNSISSRVHLLDTRVISFNKFEVLLKIFLCLDQSHIGIFSSWLLHLLNVLTYCRNWLKLVTSLTNCNYYLYFLTLHDNFTYRLHTDSINWLYNWLCLLLHTEFTYWLFLRTVLSDYINQLTDLSGKE